MIPILLVLVLLAPPAEAQQITVSLGEGGSLTARTIQLLALVTVLGLAPAIAVTITCFPFVVTVLSILRQAIGLQAAPPNMLIVTLALFLSWFVMEPVMTQAWVLGIGPFSDGVMPLEEAAPLALGPFRQFMFSRLNVETFDALAALRPGVPAASPDAPLSVLVPAFLLSEIALAFQIGFLVFLPFLVIDLVVSAILMSMGMMMVPPAIVALPFKLAFFVVADGWALISTALVRGYF